MQRIRGLGSPERTGPSAFEETRTTQASYNEDGASRHGIHKRCADSRCKAISDRDVTDCYRGQGICYLNSYSKHCFLIDLQIYVEVERARVTRILSNMKKEQGDLNAAADILCELQVETFGSMERREKTEFILEQVSLCIEKGDWTQAGILSRKISTKYFARKPTRTPEQIEKDKQEREEKEKTRSVDDPPLEKEDDVTDLKLRYYEQQITLAKHDDKYLDACKHYRQVLDTESVENNPDQLKAVSSSSLQRSKLEDILIRHSRCCKESSTT